MTFTQTKALIIIEYTAFGLVLADIEIVVKIGCSILVALSTIMIMVINLPKFWTQIKKNWGHIKKLFKW